jgi:hypothetical protein
VSFVFPRGNWKDREEVCYFTWLSLISRYEQIDDRHQGGKMPRKLTRKYHFKGFLDLIGISSQIFNTANNQKRENEIESQEHTPKGQLPEGCSSTKECPLFTCFVEQLSQCTFFFLFWKQYSTPNSL